MKVFGLEVFGFFSHLGGYNGPLTFSVSQGKAEADLAECTRRKFEPFLKELRSPKFAFYSLCRKYVVS